MDINNINANVNIKKLADQLTELTGQHIGLEHIHPSTEGRYYYIQAPKAGAPMLLHHYRGPFFIDIHPDDFKNLSSGKVSAHDYISSANWMVGYYWGGGSMLKGGYYQPIDIVKRKEETRRYLRILACRGLQMNAVYLTEEYCKKCPLERCPFSKFKEGSWNEELPEPDPRQFLFKALCKRFEQENPGYTLRGFICDEIPKDEIWLRSNYRYSEDEPYSFLTYASKSVIQELLMHEVVPENWNEYAKSFKFRIPSSTLQPHEITPEFLKRAFEGKSFNEMQQISNEENSLLKRLLAFVRR